MAQKGKVVELHLLMCFAVLQLEIGVGTPRIKDQHQGLCFALLEFERGGDLLVESPSEGSHHTSSQHSRGQAFAKPTHPPFPEICNILTDVDV